MESGTRGGPAAGWPAAWATRLRAGPPPVVWAAALHAVLLGLTVPSFEGNPLVATAFVLEVASAASMLRMWWSGVTCGQGPMILATLFTIYCCSMVGAATGGAILARWMHLAFYYFVTLSSGVSFPHKVGLAVAGSALSAATSGMSSASLAVPGLVMAVGLGAKLGSRAGPLGQAIKRGLVYFHAAAISVVFVTQAALFAQEYQDGAGGRALYDHAAVAVIALMAVIIDVFSIVEHSQHVRFMADVMPEDAAKWLVSESARRGICPGHSVPMDLLKDIAASLPYHRSHESVTVFFMDIVGYTALSSDRSPLETMAMLHEFYCYLDWHARDCEVYKVETIGDSYMVACGMEDSDPADHADHVIVFAQRVLHVAHNLGLTVRIGIDTGPITSGIVGLYRHRFCLFGDTVNTASRMESSAVHNGIHISNATYDALKNKSKLLGTSFGMTSSRIVKVKGKGTMCTYDVAAMAGGQFTRGPKTEPEAPGPEAGDGPPWNEELREALLSPGSSSASALGTPGDGAPVAMGLQRPSFGRSGGLFGSAVDLTSLVGDDSEGEAVDDSARESSGDVERAGAGEVLKPEKPAGWGPGLRSRSRRRSGESQRRNSMTDYRGPSPAAIAAGGALSQLGGRVAHWGPVPAPSRCRASKSFDVPRASRLNSRRGTQPPRKGASLDLGSGVVGEEEWRLLFAGLSESDAPDARPRRTDSGNSSYSSGSSFSVADAAPAPEGPRLGLPRSRPLKGDSVESMYMLSRQSSERSESHEQLFRLESFDYEAVGGALAWGGDSARDDRDQSIRGGRLPDVDEASAEGSGGSVGSGGSPFFDELEDLARPTVGGAGDSLEEGLELEFRRQADVWGGEGVASPGLGGRLEPFGKPLRHTSGRTSRLWTQSLK